MSRTKRFSLDIIHLFRSIRRNEEGRIIGRQLLRSAMSVGANYRASLRSRSKAEFYAKMCIVVEEADEVVYWPELIEEAKLLNTDLLHSIKKEAHELLFIFSASRKTAKS